MYFKLYHDPKNKTLAIPRAALQLSGLTDAEELILHTGGGYVMAARSGLKTSECLHLLDFLTATASSLLTQLVLNSREGAEDPECGAILAEGTEMDDSSLTIPAWLLEQAVLKAGECLEAFAEDGRIIVTEAENNKSPEECGGDDPLKEFDMGFRIMLQLAGVDLDNLRRQMRQEEMDDE